MYRDEKLAIEPSERGNTLPGMALPEEVDWSELSPRGREIVRQVGLRLAAGFSYEEIAEILERDTPPFRHLELPLGGKPISKAWVSARTRELKVEIETMSSPV